MGGAIVEGMRPVPTEVTDTLLDELATELSTTLTLFGRALGDGGPAESHESTPSANTIAGTLVDGYLSGGVYAPGAKAGIPPSWRTFRAHEFRRGSAGGGLFFGFTEYVPDVKRLKSKARPADFESRAELVFASLSGGLKTLLGKPASKGKQKVEFHWGGSPAMEGWGGVRVSLGRSSEIKLGGGDSAPWGNVRLEVQLMGAARPK